MALKFNKQNQTGRYGKTRTVKINAPESGLQKYCEDWLRAHNIKYIRIPDWLYAMIYRPRSIESPDMAAKRKSFSVYFKGIPDLVILFPWGRVCLVELKTKSRQTTGQREWARYFDKNIYHIIQTPEQFAELMTRYC